MARTTKTSSQRDRSRKDHASPDVTPNGDVTLTQEAYRRLRHDIVSGVLAAGQPLRLEALKERYGLSFSPIREALNRLQSERLVVSNALRGFRVADVSLDEMWDAIETRILVECDGLRRSIERGNDDWEARVIGAFHAFSRCAERVRGLGSRADPQQLDELETRHREFHSALISASGSRWLPEFASQLYAQTERYRRQAIQGLSGAAAARRNVDAEHRAIMDAAVGRKNDEATRRLATHYRTTGSLIEKHLNLAEAAIGKSKKA